MEGDTADLMKKASQDCHREAVREPRFTKPEIKWTLKLDSRLFP
ncbi:hypothetical protein SAMN02745166_03675 [Prosthecobacter debontii]|uniref:Uncharacterized protein n=1 Tax=Prosthecobacter debontii TaxID=48467 RepID=A0A1T4YLS5_9BACT|nr:hypothetical protein SAMN02745166_03675 [Prosthecobacter debontii]